MTIYYLYVKIHNKTGLKYLGQTTREDPIKYFGSGVTWVKHLKEYGYDIYTILLHKSEEKTEIANYGRFLSEYWNIVDSDNWANMIPETCGGGLKGNKNPMRNYKIVQKVSGSNHYMKKPGFVPRKFKTPKNMSRPGTNNPSYDPTRYYWKNKASGEICFLSKYEFKLKLGASQPNISKHVNHPDVHKSVAGWQIITK